MIIIVNNHNLYCTVYERKDRKLWKYLIKNASQFKQTYETERSIMFEWNGYKLFVWKTNELVSVNKNDKCILSYFDKKMSKKMYNSLAIGDYSHAEGGSTTEGIYSHAEGVEAEAIGKVSHSEGWRTKVYSNEELFWKNNEMTNDVKML